MSDRPGILGRIERAAQRRMARWLQRRMFTIPGGPAIISFTFDDFPRSALLTGGRMLEQAGLAGTYYASLGLMKQTIATGEIFSPEDLPGLLAHGHELACHTYNHCPAWETSASAFEASVLENAKVLQQLMPGIFPRYLQGQIFQYN